MKPTKTILASNLSFALLFFMVSSAWGQIELGDFTIRGSGEVGALPRGKSGDTGNVKKYQDLASTVKTALDFGCPWVIYWQVYDNEPKRRPVQKAEDCRGWWLKSPDGTTSFSWGILRKLMGIQQAKTN